MFSFRHFLHFFHKVLSGQWNKDDLVGQRITSSLHRAVLYFFVILAVNNRWSSWATNWTPFCSEPVRGCFPKNGSLPGLEENENSEEGKESSTNFLLSSPVCEFRPRKDSAIKWVHILLIVDRKYWKHLIWRRPHEKNQLLLDFAWIGCWGCVGGWWRNVLSYRKGILSPLSPPDIASAQPTCATLQNFQNLQRPGALSNQNCYSYRNQDKHQQTLSMKKSWK